MLERPPDVTDDEVLTVVRRHREPRADAVEHLAVGWGAHHWRVEARASPRSRRARLLQRPWD